MYSLYELSKILLLLYWVRVIYVIKINLHCPVDSFKGISAQVPHKVIKRLVCL